MSRSKNLLDFLKHKTTLMRANRNSLTEKRFRIQEEHRFIL